MAPTGGSKWQVANKENFRFIKPSKHSHQIQEPKKLPQAVGKGQYGSSGPGEGS